MLMRLAPVFLLAFAGSAMAQSAELVKTFDGKVVFCASQVEDGGLGYRLTNPQILNNRNNEVVVAYTFSSLVCEFTAGRTMDYRWVSFPAGASRDLRGDGGVVRQWIEQLELVYLNRDGKILGVQPIGGVATGRFEAKIPLNSLLTAEEHAAKAQNQPVQSTVEIFVRGIKKYQTADGKVESHGLSSGGSFVLKVTL